MRLIATRGLPGSGKTRRARRYVAECPRKRMRVSRDSFRKMFHGVRFSGLHELEEAVTVAQYATIRALLLAGYEVVTDSTWLDEGDFKRIRALAEELGAEFVVWDMRDVPPEVCIQRDADRGSLVGPEVIMGMYRRHIEKIEGV